MYVVKGREDPGADTGLWKGPEPIVNTATDPESSELTRRSFTFSCIIYNHLLRCIRWPRVCSISVNIPHGLEKNESFVLLNEILNKCQLGTTYSVNPLYVKNTIPPMHLMSLDHHKVKRHELDSPDQEQPQVSIPHSVVFIHFTYDYAIDATFWRYS
ncbi:hypothetical protein STEG23_031447 [Scotinomys teguina]